MSIVKTDLRVTRERAKQLRYYPVLPLTATNVQDAIDQVAAGALPGPGSTVAVTAAMSPYTPAANITLLLVDSTAGAVVIALPLSSSRIFDIEVKDAAGQSAVNAISVNRTAPDTIDGLTTYPIDSPYASAKFGPKTGGYFVHA